MTTQPESDARAQVVRVAEALFSERGYTAVTLRDIAERLHVKQAALYYHFPGGKEDLFVEVMTRSFGRHRAGLERAIATAQPNIAAQLKAMAVWLLSQPPLGLARFARTDLPALAPENAQTLSTLGMESLIEPVQGCINAAYARGETRLVDPQLMTSLFLSVTDSIHELYQTKQIAKEVLAQDIIDVLLDGMRRR